MLLSVRVAGFRSIREPQELDLFRGTREAKATKESAPLWAHPDVSTVAAVYGANASGKSSLVQAIAYLVEMASDSFRLNDSGNNIGVMPFLLSRTEPPLPTELTIRFIARDAREYEYSFSLDPRGVISEALSVFRTSKRTSLFKRSLSGDTTVWQFGRGLIGLGNRISETVGAHALFLAAASSNRRNEPFAAAIEWLTSDLAVYDAASYEAEHRRVIEELGAGDVAFSRKLNAFLHAADLGVKGARMIRRKLSPQDMEEFREAYDRLLAYHGSTPRGGFEEFVDLNSKSIELSHAVDGDSLALPFEMESAGTRALVSFASIAIQALETGAVCVVDEIDTSLHPLLVSQLVAIFTDPRTNPNQAQLLFTTHDVNLIDSAGGRDSALARDQVWIIEKEPDGASRLSAVTDFGVPRLEENLARRYLTGRFGGIPDVALVDELAACDFEEATVEQSFG